MSHLLNKIQALLLEDHSDAYLVGGAVRDLCRDHLPDDIDIVAKNASNLALKIAKKMSGRVVCLDDERDIIRVTIPSKDEISYVDISEIRGSIEEDLHQRDFTVDAMALFISEGFNRCLTQNIIDPVGGLRDLQSGTIKAVSDSTFLDDPVRLLRACRLTRQLGFDIHPFTRAQISRDASLLSSVASERIRDEFLRILAKDDAVKSLRMLDNLDLLCGVIPELEAAKGVVQPKEHYWDVFDHLLETVGQIEVLIGKRASHHEFVLELVPTFDVKDEYFDQPVSDGHNRLTALKLTALLHDIAKPAMKTVDPSGRIRFLGHDKEGGSNVGTILERLRCSNKMAAMARTMVTNHLRPNQMAPPGCHPSNKAIFRYYRDVGSVSIDTLYLSMADHLAARGPDLRRDEWAIQCEIIDHILRNRPIPAEASTPRSILNGNDLMSLFSLSPGPIIGILLETLEEAQVSGQVNTTKEAFDLVKSKLESGGISAKVR